MKYQHPIRLIWSTEAFRASRAIRIVGLTVLWGLPKTGPIYIMMGMGMGVNYRLRRSMQDTCR